jgi:hypothetical protein
LLSVDTDGYRSASLQVTSVGSGNTIAFETSEDNVTFVACYGHEVSTNTRILTSGTNVVNSRWKFGNLGKYFRVRVSVYGSGTVTVVGYLRKSDFQEDISTVSRPRANNSTTLCPTNLRVQSAATTNATSVKASAGVLNQAILTNNAAGLAYVKFYNKASSPTVGTDVPIATIALPANGLPVVIAPPAGIAFSTGIAYAITGLATDADTTAVLANQVTGIIGYS